MFLAFKKLIMDGTKRMTLNLSKLYNTNVKEDILAIGTFSLFKTTFFNLNLESLSHWSKND